MKLKNIVSSLAMVGALASSGAAFAQSWTGHHRSDDNDTSARRHTRVRVKADIIGTRQLDEGRGVATFKIKPEMRRDGLALATDGANVKILSVEFVYSDGRVVKERVRQTMGDGQAMTIQTGRPPGLRTVRVRYAMNDNDYYDSYSYSTRLRLVQLHTGDGYTHEEDLWKYHDDEGYYPDED